MQEDKETAFDALDSLSLCIAAMTAMVTRLKVNEEAMRASAAKGFSTATDLADWLVRTLDMPFRNAHHVTGTLVAKAEAKGCDLDGLSLAEMQETEPRITEEVYSVLGIDNSVKSRTSFGGTAPDNVKAMAAFWEKALAGENKNGSAKP
jgi:argininosuccinate lyase